MADQTSATAPIAIGTVVAIEGTAHAKNPVTGEMRVLQQGDLVYADEVIVTAENGAVAIELTDGTRLDLGRNSEMALDNEVFDVSRLAYLDEQDDDAEADISGDDDIDEIQQALLAGVDPTDPSAELEATAAGPASGGGENEGSSFVILDRSDQSTTPDSGYATDPLSVQFTPPPEEVEELIEPLDSADTAPVANADAAEGGVTEGRFVEGNVLENDDFGEDGPGDPPVANPGTYEGQYGTLTLNEDGSYSYTANPGLQHKDEEGNPLTLEDQFSYTIVDGDGTTSSSTLTILVTDTGPVANPDNVQASDQNNTIQGNVIEGRSAVDPDEESEYETDPDAQDQLNTDVEITVTQISGDAADGETPEVGDQFTTAQGGTLVVQPNGDYTYTLPAGARSLDDDESFVESFTYTITDADGSTSESTLTITVVGTNDGPQITTDAGNPGDANDEVNESALSTGSGGGTDTAAGTFTVSDPDGLQDIVSVTIAGGPDGDDTFTVDDLNGASTADPLTVAGDHGTLKITGYDNTTGVATYEYTLSEATTEGVNDQDVFTLTTTDGTATSDPASITIDIVDDTPTAVNDADSVDTDTTELFATGNVVTGNDLATGNDTNTTDGSADTTGADGFQSINWVDDTNNDNVLEGTYGNLTVGADGSYTYTLTQPLHADIVALDDGEQLANPDTFDYTITDGDVGDNDVSNQATLTIAVIGSNDGPQITTDAGNPGDANDEVNESALSTGSGGGTDTAAGTFTVSDPDGLQDIVSVTIAGGPDGDDTFTVDDLNGASTADPLTVAGDHGTLKITGYDNTTGVATYEYTLSEATTEGVNDQDVFTLTTTDGTATSDPASITIDIVDDTPTAVNDADSVDTDTTELFATGNVVTGNDLATGNDTNTTDGSADTTGADGFQSINWVDDTNNDNVLEGTYGNLTVGADGSYTYTLTQPLHADIVALDDGEQLANPDTFDYTITDGDVGDNDVSNQATLTIAVIGSNDGPQITTDAGNPGDANDEVNESALSTGSGGGTDTAAGTFTVSDPDGLQDIVSVTIAGGPDGDDTFTVDDLNGASTADPLTVAGDHGTLKITGYDNTTGVATYEYTLSEATTEGVNDQDVFTLTTTDGTATSDPASITIDIVDDTPTAVNDADSVDTDTTELFATGNVVTGNDLATGNDTNTTDGSADTTGADGFQSINWVDDTNNDNVLEGTYGNLTVGADGSYTYTLTQPLHADIVALDDGEQLANPDTFDYTITDGDVGDNDVSNQATLTIAVIGSNDGPQITTDAGNPGDANDEVNESALSTGSGGGTDTAAGTFTVSDPDGLQDIVSVTIAGGPDGDDTFTVDDLNGASTADPLTVAGDHGTLKITGYDNTTGVATYEYTLSEATTEGVNDQDVFTLTTTDGTATSDPASITIDIVDDTPTAVNDADSVDTDTTELFATGNVVTGNDLATGNDTNTTDGSADTTGADGFQSINWVDDTNNDNVLEGTYGNLTVGADGSYTYTLTQPLHADIVALDDGEQLANPDTFDYTITDGDVGDNDVSNQATLTIAVIGSNDGPQITTDAGNPGDANDEVNESALSTGSGGGTDTAAGTFTVSDPDGLQDIVSVTIAGGPDGDDTFTVDDLNGASTADPLTVAGDHGTLKITGYDNTTGVATYEYTLSEATTEGVNDQDVFTLTTTDGTATSDPASITIDIVDDTPTAVNDADSVDTDTTELFATGNVVTGNDLATGNDTNTTDGSADTTGADGFQSINWVDDTNNDNVLEGTYGNLTVGADGSYTYTLTQPLHADIVALDDGEQLANPDTFDYTITDGDVGDNDVSNQATLTIAVIGSNDGPQITTDAGNPGDANDEVNESALSTGSGGGTDTAAGTFTVSDPDGLQDIVSVTIAGGPDGDDTFTVDDLNGASTADPLTVAGDHGTLKITGYDNTTGVATYEYTLSEATTEGVNDQDVFTLTTTDGTATSDPASITIDIVDDTPTAVNDADSVDTDTTELFATGNVVTGNDLATGNDTNTTDGSADTTGADGFQSINWVDDTNNDNVLEGTYGNLTVGADGSYTYTLTQPLHADIVALDDGEQLANPDTFDYTITDGDVGDNDVSNQATLTIAVIGSNDGPQITTDAGNPGDANDEVNESALSTGSGGGTDTAAGTFTVSDPDGLQDIVSVTIAGGPDGDDTFTVDDLNGASTADPLTVAGDHGTLKITGYDNTTGVATYEYTLSEATTEGVNDQDVFTLTTTDGTATSDPASITIDIVDDTPTAVNDADSVDTDTTELFATGNVVTGNDLATGNDTNTTDGSADTTGADGFQSINWVDDTNNDNVLEGTYGNLTVGADGSYTYTLTQPLHADIVALDDGEQLANPDTFDYTITDGDVGDNDVSNQATLTIAVIGSNDGPQITTDAGNPGDANDEVNESALSTGSGGGTDTAAGTFTVSDPDGLQDIVSVTIAGGPDGDDTFTVDDLNGASTADPLTVAGDHGTLKITGYDNTTGVATYEYTLSEATTEGVNDQDVFTLTTTDGTATSDPASITIDIVDDTPTIAPTDTGVTEIGLTPNTPDNVTGHLNIEAGADGLASLTLATDGSTVAYHNGEAVTYKGLSLDGKYTFGTNTLDVFTIELDSDVDNDGTSDAGQYTFTLLNSLDHSAEDKLLTGDNLVVNGDFEAGADSIGRNQWQGFSEGQLTGWHIMDDSGYADSAELVGGYDDPATAPDSTSSDSVHLDLEAGSGNDQNVWVYQDIDTSSAQSFQLSFAYNDHQGGATDQDGAAIEVIWNGVTLSLDDADVTRGTDGWDTYTFTVDGDSDGSTRLEFRGADATPDAMGGYIDDVGVYALTDTLDFGVTVADGDGDTADGTFSVTVEDGIPTVGLSGQAPGQLRTDESLAETGGDGILSASRSFSTAFAQPDYAADGPGTATYSLTLNDAGTGSVASGLFATDPNSANAAQGPSIVMSRNASTGNIEGRIGDATTGTLVFIISVIASGANAGTVTFELVDGANVWHADTANPDDAASILTANASDLQLIQTVTDFDGDSATAALDLGQNVFKIEDDGPRLGLIQEGILTAEGGTLEGVLEQFYGADDAGTLNISLADGVSLPTNVRVSDPVTNPDGSVTIVAKYYEDATDPNLVTGDFFELTVLQDGTYTFELANQSSSDTLTFSESGNKPQQYHSLDFELGDYSVLFTSVEEANNGNIIDGHVNVSNKGLGAGQSNLVDEKWGEVLTMQVLTKQPADSTYDLTRSQSEGSFDEDPDTTPDHNAYVESQLTETTDKVLIGIQKLNVSDDVVNWKMTDATGNNYITGTFSSGLGENSLVTMTLDIPELIALADNLRLNPLTTTLLPGVTEVSGDFSGMQTLDLWSTSPLSQQEGGTFRVTSFTFESDVPADPIDPLTFDVSIVDVDGDASLTEQLEIDVVDPVSGQTGYTINGEDNVAESILGSDGHDTIDSGLGADQIDGGLGNDFIIYDELDTIDGGLGNDTLVVHGNVAIDGSKLSSIETIDMTDGGSTQDSIALSAADVIGMTDSSSRTLHITGDANTDAVKLSNAYDGDGDNLNDGSWQDKTTNDTETGYKQYEYVPTNGGDALATVLVQDTLNVQLPDGS